MKKEEFLENQQKNFSIVLCSHDGKCPQCRYDTIQHELEKKNHGQNLLTGCQKCGYSFCE